MSSTSGTPGLTAALAQMAAQLELRSIPGNAIVAAKRSLLDSIACGVVGSRISPARDIAKLVTEQGGRPDAKVWGSTEAAPASAAALAIGAMIHAQGYDDFHSKLHPSSVVIAAGMPVAERSGASGAQLLTALVAGYEVMIRVGLALDTTSSFLNGWRATSVCGTLGAAAVTGRLLGLSADQMEGAFGLAGSQSSGLFSPIAGGNVALRLDPAFAARNGVVASELASNGVFGSPIILEAPFGGLLGMMSDNSNSLRGMRGLGSTYLCAALSHKLIPLPMSLTSAGEAAATLHTQVDSHKITSVTLRTSQAVHAECSHQFTSNGPLSHRQLEAQLSAPYVIAACLLHGPFTLSLLEEKYLNDRTIMDLARIVRVEIDPAIDELYPHALTNEVSVSVEGMTAPLVRRVDHPIGSESRPLTQAEHTSKSDTLLRSAGLDRTQVGAIRHFIEDLETQTTLDPLLALLPVTLTT